MTKIEISDEFNPPSSPLTSLPPSDAEGEDNLQDYQFSRHQPTSDNAVPGCGAISADRLSSPLTSLPPSDVEDYPTSGQNKCKRDQSATTNKESIDYRPTISKRRKRSKTQNGTLIAPDQSATTKKELIDNTTTLSKKRKQSKTNSKQLLTPEEIALDESDAEDEDYQPNLQLEEDKSDDIRTGDPTGESRSRPGPSANNSRQPAPPTNTDSNARKRTRTTQTVAPRNPITTSLTLENYSTNGRQLGRPALEKLLNDPKRKTQNRPPSNILAEAQALQGYYTMDKMSLSLVGNTSLATLESALFEGPISRDRNGYTTWMSYSLANTAEISMPAGRQPEGFAEHNQNCRKWTQLTNTEKEIFQPKLFEKLAYAHFSEIATPVSQEERASDQEITEYMPHFTQLANLTKVSTHLKSGVLGQTIAKSLAVIEKRGREEIGKVAIQLQSIYKRFGIHSHLLVASWNPKTKLDDPMWNPEYTTCPRWAKYAKKNHHLARDFAIRSTAAQIESTDNKQVSNVNNKTPQESMRAKLSNLLNHEIST
ncbi:uncharacterized protein MELLADRAFT_69799 [Melampsora larici-populina 98AG31]|uniref:Uncharacterized protein n=1 Tax=Melampsora larici-populina (strain 98AG31 / pathotype 3-4-7) TaxID=747676 RepID=F4SC78_MELLP|nr:uncharacterized protein MELLADRAFT_69799 [Melampsora larici-populina 98AG31]EGF97733.1 hypothetical protein MELLADRAFT_69799 [Melampsora larici-populina 98AG31]